MTTMVDMVYARRKHDAAGKSYVFPWKMPVAAREFVMRHTEREMFEYWAAYGDVWFENEVLLDVEISGEMVE
jgi:hypothetical protein